MGACFQQIRFGGEGLGYATFFLGNATAVFQVYSFDCNLLALPLVVDLQAGNLLLLVEDVVGNATLQIRALALQIQGLLLQLEAGSVRAFDRVRNLLGSFDCLLLGGRVYFYGRRRRGLFIACPKQHPE